MTAALREQLEEGLAYDRARGPNEAKRRYRKCPSLHRRIIVYTMMCAYLSALPFSLTMSFYPLLLAEFGHGEAASGVLLGLRAAGSILASLLTARFVRSGPQTLWPVVCGLAVAVSIGFVPIVNHVVPIAFWMLVVGAGTAAMTLYFQIDRKSVV